MTITAYKIQTKSNACLSAFIDYLSSHQVARNNTLGENRLAFRRDLLNHDTIAVSAWLARQQ